MFYEIFVGGIVSVTTFSLTIAVPLYIIVLTVIISQRKLEPFNSEFFVIFFALGISDLGCYFLYVTKKIFFLGYVPSFFLPYNEPNLFAGIYYYPFWVCSILQQQLTFFLGFNRFISIVFPFAYNKHWKRKKTYIIICVCVFNALMLASPILCSHGQINQYVVEFDGRNRTLQSGPVLSSVKTMAYLNTIWLIEVYGLLLANGIFYGIMIKTLRNTKMVGNKKKLEVQMFWTGFMLFVLHLVFAIYFFLRDTVLVNLSVNPHVHEWILMFISDIYDLPNGFVLWLTSTSIRRIIIQKIRHILSGRSFDAVVWLKTLSSHDLHHNNRPVTATAIPKNPPHLTVDQEFF